MPAQEEQQEQTEGQLNAEKQKRPVAPSHRASEFYS